MDKRFGTSVDCKRQAYPPGKIGILDICEMIPINVGGSPTEFDHYFVLLAKQPIILKTKKYKKGGP